MTDTTRPLGPSAARIARESEALVRALAASRPADSLLAEAIAQAEGGWLEWNAVVNWTVRKYGAATVEAASWTERRCSTSGHPQALHRLRPECVDPR